MADSVTEKLVQSLNRINGELLDTSEKTILSLPGLKNVSSSTKALWLGEDGIIDAFRHSFEKLQVDEKRKAVDDGEIPDITDKTRVSAADKLIEQKTLLEKEIEKILENQALIESTISNSLQELDKTVVHNEDYN